MALRVVDIAQEIKKQIEAFEAPIEAVDIGTVIEVGDGVARVRGLSGVMASELVEFPEGLYGMALNLEKDNVGVILLGDYSHIEEGDIVRSTGRIISVPVG
ncbi:MAG: F0F1 ATP synthase subunit alpha, partial [Chloroflexi bacterium]